MFHNVCPFSQKPCASNCALFIKVTDEGDPICAIMQAAVEVTLLRSSLENRKEGNP